MANWNELYEEEIFNAIDYLSDRIQPFVLFKMPDKRYFDKDKEKYFTKNGEWIEYPLGVFLMSTPVKKEVNNRVYRDIEAYDGLVILEDDKFIDRYTIKAGTKYYDAMIDVLKSAGIEDYNIEYSDKKIKTDMEFSPGDEKRKAANALSAALNYTPFYVDEFGYFTSHKYVSPQERPADYEYTDDKDINVTYNGMEEELDLYGVANVWVATFSNVDGATDENGNPVDPVFLKSSYTNDNRDSQTSTVNRGRRIVDPRQVENIADQEALNDYVKRIAFEASQIFGKVKFETAIMPFHGYQDVLYLKNETLGIDGKYLETNWQLSFEAGGKMVHEVRAVVDI